MHWIIRGLPLLCALAAATARADLSLPEGSAFVLPADASLDLACGDLDLAGASRLDGAHLRGLSDVRIAAGGRLEAQSGRISFGGDWSNAGQFDAGSSLVELVDACGDGSTFFSGPNLTEFATLHILGSREITLPVGTLLRALSGLQVSGAGTGALRFFSAGAGLAVLDVPRGIPLGITGASIAANVRIGPPPLASAPVMVPSGSAVSSLALALAILLAGACFAGVRARSG